MKGSEWAYKLPTGAEAVGSVALDVAKEAYSSVGQNAAATNGNSVADININLQSFVKLDGEQVGYAVWLYQQRQMMYSNGR